LVVDDHPLVRQALQNVLRQLDTGTVVVEAPDCSIALDLAAADADLDIVLLDLHLPGMGGLDALSLLRERHPGLPVVVLSADDNRQTVLEAIEKGAMGFIPKSSSNEVMLSAMRLVMSGGIYLPPAILEHASVATAGSVADGTAMPAPPVRTLSDLGLTERQFQVLALLLQGKSNKLICRELGLAEGTVKIHVSAILKALNVTSRTQAVLAAGRMGLAFEGLDQSAGS
jgi:DNA-binding NarL/FixJ family response regulator